MAQHTWTRLNRPLLLSTFFLSVFLSIVKSYWAHLLEISALRKSDEEATNEHLSHEQTLWMKIIKPVGVIRYILNAHLTDCSKLGLQSISNCFIVFKYPSRLILIVCQLLPKTDVFWRTHSRMCLDSIIMLLLGTWTMVRSHISTTQRTMTIQHWD